MIHAEDPTHGSDYADKVYTFLAAAKANHIVPVKLKVKEYSYTGQMLPQNIRDYFESNPKEYAVSYDTVVLEVEEIEESPPGSARDITEHDVDPSPEELSTIKITDLLNLVKGDAKKYIPRSEQLKDTQTAGIQAAKILQKLGICGEVSFYESYMNDQGQRVFRDKDGGEKPAPNGWYGGDGSIHIDLNAGEDGNGLVLFTLAHELTHHIQRWSPQKYQALVDFLDAEYGKGESLVSRALTTQEQLSNLRGKRITMEEAQAEMIANSLEGMLADGNVLDKLIKLKQKDLPLLMKMKQFFENLLHKIRGIYKDVQPDTEEGRVVLEMTDSLEKIQQLFADALADAGQNFRKGKTETKDSENSVVNEEEMQYSRRYPKPLFKENDDLGSTPEQIKCRNGDLEGKEHPQTGVQFKRKRVEVDGKQYEVTVPEFESSYDARLPENMYEATDREQFKECNLQLKNEVATNKDLREQFNDKQLEQIENDDTPRGYTWHHDAEAGKMQLVDAGIHRKTGHTGGRFIWGGGRESR